MQSRLGFLNLQHCLNSAQGRDLTWSTHLADFSGSVYAAMIFKPFWLLYAQMHKRQ